MKKQIHYFFIVIAFLVCCSAAMAQAKIKVACVGNSITEGARLPAGKTYPEQLQQLLGEAYEVKNFGLGGRTLLKKGDIPYWNESKYTEALQWSPDIVIIKLGTNDSKPQNWKWGSEFRQDYMAFVNSFKQASNSPKIYACYPLPVFEYKWGITDSIVKNEIIPAIKKAAKKTKSKVINLYKPFIGKAELTYDGVHPNAEGCTLLASEVYKAIKKIRLISFQ